MKLSVIKCLQINIIIIIFIINVISIIIIIVCSKMKPISSPPLCKSRPIAEAQAQVVAAGWRRNMLQVFASLFNGRLRTPGSCQ